MPIVRTIDIGNVHVHLHDFEEEEHPRGKKGTSKGGQFVKKGASGTASTKTVSKTKPVTSTEKPVRQLRQTTVRTTLVSAPDREKWPAHIKALKVPPAWQDIRINPDPKANLLVVGKDSKGRDQYVYSAKYAETQSAKKFERVKKLAEKLPQLQAKNDKNLLSKDPKIREHAECLGLIMGMGIRPGSERDTGAEKQAFGATTLLGQHVVTEGNSTYLRFTGKKGVDLNLKVDDPELANALKKRAELVGPNNQLFKNITDSSLRSYTSILTNKQAKPKDFRTLLASATSYDIIKTMPKPTSATAYKKAVMQVAKQVADKLGNTAKIALTSYISPYVFAEWKESAGIK